VAHLHLDSDSLLALAVLTLFDLNEGAYRDNEEMFSNFERMARNIGNSGKKIRLLQFFCPRTNDDVMDMRITDAQYSQVCFSNFAIVHAKNNFSVSVSDLNILVGILKKIWFEVDFLLFGALTDEEDYYFPVFKIGIDDATKKLLYQTKLDQREAKLRLAHSVAPELEGSIEIRLWQDRMKQRDYHRAVGVYSQEEDQRDFNKIVRALQKPRWNFKFEVTDDQRWGVLQRKRSQYANEGAELDEVYGPTHIFLQSEPVDKTRMFGFQELPVIHPYLPRT